MTPSNFQTLVTRVLSDDGFAGELAKNPEAALKSAGIDATPEVLEALQGVDANAIRKLAESLGEEQAAS